MDPTDGEILDWVFGHVRLYVIVFRELSLLWQKVCLSGFQVFESHVDEKAQPVSVYPLCQPPSVTGPFR